MSRPICDDAGAISKGISIWWPKDSSLRVRGHFLSEKVTFAFAKMARSRYALRREDMCCR